MKKLFWSIYILKVLLQNATVFITPPELYFPGDNLLVGTRQGHLLLYSVKDGTGDVECCCVRKNIYVAEISGICTTVELLLMAISCRCNLLVASTTAILFGPWRQIKVILILNEVNYT